MSLTEDDKKWLMELMETFAAKFATKQDLERVETRLLTEFHKWASPLDMRVRSHSAALRAIDVELEAVADRVSKIEGEKGSGQAH